MPLILLQMEVGGILSQLMLLDVGGQKFVVDCFLLLSPEKIKSCRLVSRQWDEIIMKEVWEHKRKGEAGSQVGEQVKHCGSCLSKDWPGNARFCNKLCLQ